MGITAKSLSASKEVANGDKYRLKFFLFRMFKIIAISSFLSFLISEAAYFTFQFLVAPVSPLSIFVSSLIVIASTAVVDILFSDEIAFLTLATSCVGIVCMINLGFGVSPVNRLFPVDSVLVDALIFAGFSVTLYFILQGVKDALTSTRITRKRILMAIGVIGLISVLTFFVVYNYELIVLFDTHPWAATIIVSLATFVLGALGWGQRRRKSK